MSETKESVTVAVDVHAVDVFKGAEMVHVGGITTRRCTEGLRAVGEAVECILRGLGYHVTVRDRR